MRESGFTGNPVESKYGMIELWFDENFYGMNWAIIYYPLGIEPPKDVPNYEHTEEIKDGFYRYYYYPGF